MIQSAEIDFIADVLKKRAGIVIGMDKSYLLESRLKPIANRLNIEDVSTLLRHIKACNDETLVQEVTEAMTTNETFFFRDIHPFDFFQKEALHEIINKNLADKTLRIWCAASSTGQEPYSLAMILKEEEEKLKGWHIEILATDINNGVLERAKEGLFSQFEVQRGLPSSYLVKYFKQDGRMWRLNKEIRNMVKFKNFNLLDSMDKIEKQDAIFCRNVLIYFDNETKKQVLSNLHNRLNKNGYLVLGASETIFCITDAFAYIPNCKSIYRPI